MTRRELEKATWAVANELHNHHSTLMADVRTLTGVVSMLDDESEKVRSGLMDRKSAMKEVNQQELGDMMRRRPTPPPDESGNV